MPEKQFTVDKVLERVRVSLDGLILEIRNSAPDGDALDRLAAAVQVSEALGQVGDHLVSFFIDDARTAGESWAAIGEKLGISRQAVQKRYTAAAAHRQRMPLVYEKMTGDGRRAVVRAQDEARRRQSGYIGTEHLLLGIAAYPECTGGRALAACGAPAETVVAAVNGRIGVPTGAARTENYPFTGKGKSVLEHALRESVRLGHDFVSSGHLALGCSTVRDGIAAEILGNLGVHYDELRSAVAGLVASESRASGSA
jgi:hypothetical protein